MLHSVSPDAGRPRQSFKAIKQGIMTMPGMAEHLCGIDLDDDGQPDLFVPQPGAPFIGFSQPPLNGRGQHPAARAHRVRRKNATLLSTLAATDPLFERVYPLVKEYIRHLPGMLAQHMLAAADTHPGMFLELYEHIRDFAETAGLACAHRVASPTGAGSGRMFRPDSASRPSPPHLESAGSIDDRQPAATRGGELAELKARARSGKARDGDLLRYIELMMGT
ncbi:hypothetical protein [Fundidesulfovibrio soli]|uniref:hypothetical protein n=1 Tax=Fundidesulfovibrio soli TaxID=2922716 RepID=UPI001FAF2B27|nr:hypothetical protein [Fundidesulfovibrio soli]